MFLNRMIFRQWNQMKNPLTDLLFNVWLWENDWVRFLWSYFYIKEVLVFISIMVIDGLGLYHMVSTYVEVFVKKKKNSSDNIVV